MTCSLRFLSAGLLCMALAACAERTPPPAAPPPVALPPPPPPGEPAGLPGMHADQLRVAFGAPVLVRKDGATEMWRYDNPACKAFFFLYVENGALAVRHVETVPRGQEMAADQACLDSIRAHPVPVS